MMRGNRNRSPDGDRRRHYDPRDSRQPPVNYGQPSQPTMPSYNHPPPQYQQQQTPPESHRQHQRGPPSPTFSFTSTSSEDVVDISRYKDTKQFGGILGTFFRAPSEKHRRRKAKQTRRVLYFGNSSSSSVNSDLAYGQGYLKRAKSRSFSPRSRRSSQEHRRPEMPPQLPSRRERDHAPKHKRSADEEIMALGRQLTGLAKRQQHEEEHRHSGKGKVALALGAGAVGASMLVSKYGRSKQSSGYSSSRGIGSSRPQRSDSDDESDWEDASDDESSSSSDGSDSVLAYGATASQVARPAALAAAAVGGAAATAGAMSYYRYGAESSSAHASSHKSSVVDPQLFGPYNSLRGMINTPCGFGDRDQSSRYHYSSTTHHVSTSDSTRLDAHRTSATSSSRQDTSQHPVRPAPVPIQQPIPIVPVSSKVYNAEKYEERRDSRHSREKFDAKYEERRDSHYSREKSDEKDGWGKAAAAGLAAAAIGTAVVASSSSRKEEKEESRRYDEERRERRDDRVEEKWDRENQRYGDEKRNRDSKRKDRLNERMQKEFERDKDTSTSKYDSYTSKYDSYTSKYSDDQELKRSSRHDDHDDTLRKRKEKETAVVVVPHKDLVSYDRRGEETKVDYTFDSRNESHKYATQDVQKALPPSTMAGQEVVAGTSQSTQETSKAVVDPFQFQVHDDAFMTPKFGAPNRPLTPMIVTVDREPNFDDSPPRTLEPDARLSRKDSFELEKMVEEYRKEFQNSSQMKGPSQGHEYEEDEHKAKAIYEEAKLATIPVAAAVVASAIAVEQERSREKKDKTSDTGSGDSSSRSRDIVQEEADRYYRESVIARRIASDEIRSRSTSPDRSVVDKWRDEGGESFTIVTPPVIEEHEKEQKESLFDGPNADVKIDNRIFPHEAHRFRISPTDIEMPIFKSRDPSAERERPVLNLVYPTPVPSREPSPMPAQQETSREVAPESETEPEVSKPEVEDLVLGPKGGVLPMVPTAKSVTWGENETKSFEVESPEIRSDSESYVPSETADRPRPRLNKASRWGAIAAAMALSSKEPINEPEPDLPLVKQKEVAVTIPDESSRDISVLPVQSYADDSSQEPPVPGPKPTSPALEHMPGSYADDIEFAATLAAGLKDTGFDDNMVIENPTFARRESPPGVQDANGDHSWYKRPHVEAVTDFPVVIPAVKTMPDQGFVLGEVETPQLERSAIVEEKPIDYMRGALPSDPLGSPTDEATARAEESSDARQSKREQRKREKVVVVQDDGTSRFEDAEAGPSREPREEVWEDIARPRSKKYRRSREFEDQSSQVFAPIESRREHRSSRDYPPREVRSDDEWDAPKRHERQARRSRSSNKDDDLSRAIPSALAIGALGAYAGHRLSKDRSRSRSREPRSDDERDSSRKSRKHRKDRDYNDDDRSRVSAPVEFRDIPHIKSSSREARSDDEWETARKSSRSKRDSHDSPTREVTPSEASSSSRRSKREKRRSGTEEDFYDYGDSPRERRRGHFDDREVSSVVSESRRDDRNRERGHRRKSSRNEDDDIKSVASAPGSGSSRRSRDLKDRRDPEKRSSGVFSSIFKSSKDKKRDSFLDNADILGTGVGLAGTAAVASSAVHSNATDAPTDKEHDVSEHFDRIPSYSPVDPEIAPRAIKPAIDPQYGDLLPLPPSEPSSPLLAPDELPTLPESRPDTPPEERTRQRDMLTHKRHRSVQDTPVKSPSHTAIPIQLRLGQRSNPQSPVGRIASPVSFSSPVRVPDSPRRTPRPTSWDSTREFKPLYLLEHSRRAAPFEQLPLPELPPSEASEPESRGSPEPEFHRDMDYFGPGFMGTHFTDPALQIDTSVPEVIPTGDVTGSGETTPRAETRPELPILAPIEAAEPKHQSEPSRELVLMDEAPKEFSQEPLTAEFAQLPVQTVSDERSLDLRNMKPTPLEILDSFARPQSPSQTTPTKQTGSNSMLTENLDDLTSADEHFSDAKEGQSDNHVPAESFYAPREAPILEEPSAKEEARGIVIEALPAVAAVETTEAIPAPITEEPVDCPVKSANEPEAGEASRELIIEPVAETVAESIKLLDEDAPEKERAVEELSTEAVSQTVVEPTKPLTVEKEHSTEDLATDSIAEPATNPPFASEESIAGVPTEKEVEPQELSPDLIVEPTPAAVVEPAEPTITTDNEAKPQELSGELTPEPTTVVVAEPAEPPAEVSTEKELSSEDPPCDLGLELATEPTTESITEPSGAVAEVVTEKQPTDIVPEPSVEPFGRAEPLVAEKEHVSEELARNLIADAIAEAVAAPLEHSDVPEHVPEAITEPADSTTEVTKEKEPLAEQPINDTVPEPTPEAVAELLETQPEIPAETAKEPVIEEVTKEKEPSAEKPSAEEPINDTVPEPTPEAVAELLETQPEIPAEAAKEPVIEEVTKEKEPLVEEPLAKQPINDTVPEPTPEAVAEPLETQSEILAKSAKEPVIEEVANEATPELEKVTAGDEVTQEFASKSAEPATESVTELQKDIAAEEPTLEATLEPVAPIVESVLEAPSATVNDPATESAPEAAIDVSSEPPVQSKELTPDTRVEPVEHPSEPVQVIDDSVPEPATVVTPPAEHEFTQEQWDNLSGKERKKVKKNLKKKDLEVIIVEPAQIPPPADKGPEEPEASKEAEVLQSEEATLTEDIVSKDEHAAPAEPVVPAPAEPDSVDKGLPAPEPEAPPATLGGGPFSRTFRRFFGFGAQEPEALKSEETIPTDIISKDELAESDSIDKGLPLSEAEAPKELETLKSEETISTDIVPKDELTEPVLLPPSESDSVDKGLPSAEPMAPTPAESSSADEGLPLLELDTLKEPEAPKSEEAISLEDIVSKDEHAAPAEPVVTEAESDPIHKGLPTSEPVTATPDEFDSVDKGLSPPQPEETLTKAENEFTQEEWDNLSGKERKKIKKNLKKKELEVAIMAAPQILPLSDKTPEKPKTPEGEEVTSTEDAVLKNEFVEPDLTEKEMPPLVDEAPKEPGAAKSEEVISTEDQVSKDELPKPDSIDKVLPPPADDPPKEYMAPKSQEVIAPVETGSTDKGLPPSVDSVSKDLEAPKSEEVISTETQASKDEPADPDSIDKELTPSEPKETLAPAENEFTQEKWDNLSGKERKRIKKNLKKKDMEVAIVAAPIPPADEAPEEPKVSEGEETISTEKQALTDESAAPESTNIELPPSEPDAPLTRDSDSIPATEQEPPASQEPDTLPAEKSPEAVTEPDASIPGVDAQDAGVITAETPAAEEPADGDAQPQSKGSKKKKKKKGKAAALEEEESAQMEPTAAESESVPEGSSKQLGDAPTVTESQLAPEESPTALVETELTVVEPETAPETISKQSVDESSTQPDTPLESANAPEAETEVSQVTPEGVPEPSSELNVERELAPEPTTESIPEETSETSSKSKKKKKKKGVQSQNPLPSETPEPATSSDIAEITPAQEAALPEETDVAKDLPQEPTEAILTDVTTPAEQNTPAEAEEPELTETSKSKKKTKRNKSVHFEPEDGAPPTPAQETTTTTPPQEDTNQFVDAQEAQAAPEEATKPAEESTSIASPSEPDAQKTPEDPSVNEPAEDEFSAWDMGIESPPETVEVIEQSEIKPDTPAGADNTPVETEKPAALESHISEPLFSQGDVPFEDSQVTSTDLEPSQLEESPPAPSDVNGNATPDDEQVAKEPEASVVSATTETPEATEDSSKKAKKNKKKKKKNQAAEEETTEEPKSMETQSEEASLAPADTVEAIVDKPVEEPQTEQTPAEPPVVVEDTANKPVVESVPITPQESSHDHTEALNTDEPKVQDDLAHIPEGIVDKSVEESTPDTLVETREPGEMPAVEESEPASGKKSKKKKKKSKSVSFAETGQDAPQEPTLESSEPATFTQEPLTQEPEQADEVAPAPATEPSSSGEAPIPGEAIPSTPAEDSPESPAPVEPATPSEDTTLVEQDAEAEIETPKKGKKNKKKKKKSSTSLDDGENQPEGEPSSQDPSDGIKAPTTDEPTPDGVDQQNKSTEKSVEASLPSEEPAPPLEREEIPEVTPESDEQTKSADIEPSIEPPPAQDPADAPAANTTPDALVSDDPTADTTVTSTEDPEPLSAKKSKKDKKKKKKKGALEESTEPESGAVTPSEETGAGPATETAAERSEDTQPEPETTETTTAEPAPEADITTLGDETSSAAPNESGEPPVSSQEPEAIPEDERGGSSLKISEDKKNKKAKDIDFQNLQDPKINPPPEPEPELEKEDAARKSDEAGSLETSEMDKGVKEEEPVVAPEAPVESEAKPETEKQEIVDEYAGLSKKQIKKLKKAKALAALESSVELEKPKESEALAEGPRESAVEPTVEPESKPEPQTDRMVDQTTEPDVDSGSKLENEATSAVEPEIVPLVEPETEAESKSETETQPSIDTETQMSVAEPSVAESATYPNLESDTKPEHEPELLERKISDAPEPDLEAAETPNDEVLLTKPTADDTESKPKPKAQRKLSEPPLEVVEAPAITELSSAIEENPSTESELAPVGKPVEEEAPPTLEKDKKKQKEKKKGKNQDVEPPADTKDLKEAEAVPVEETPIETVVPAEPVAEHAPEAVESSRETAESLPAATEDDPISTEPVDEILQGAVDPAAEAVDPAPLPESERGSTIEAEAQGVPAELTEQTESTPIDVSTVDAIPEAAPTPEIIPKSETDPESKEDDETIAVLSGKEKKKKKTAKGKTADPEPSEEPDQSKEVDLAPTTMPTDNAQPGPAAEVVEPPQGTTLAPDVTAEAAVSEHPSETETHVESEPAAFFPKPDASGALEPTSSVVNPELESKPVEEAATEQRRELQSELTLAAEPNRDLVDPLALETVFATDLSAETPLETAQPEPEQQADNDEDAALSKKDKKKKKKKKKGKEPAVDTRDESEAQKEEDEGTVNTEPVEPAAPVDTDKAIEVDTVPEPKAVDKTGLADQEPAAVEASVPTQPIKEIESSEQHHSAVEAQEPGQPVEAAEPGKQDKPSTQTLELAPIIEQPEPIEPASTQSPQQAETPKSSVEIVPKPGHHVQLQPDEAQGTEPAASPNKSKKKKKKGKTANSDSFGEAEPLKEPEVATETTTDATSEPILKPAPDNTPETALEHGDQPEPEEPMRDTETSPVLDRRIDVMQDKTTEYSEDGEEPTVLPSETLTEPEPVPVESVPEHASAETAAEPEAQRATEPVPEPLPELLPEPQGANDLDASLPKKDLKKKKKKKSKGATIDLEEPVELVKDDVSKDGTPESFDAVESAIFEPVAEPEPTQEPTQVPTRGPELAPEMEKAAEVEPEAAPEAQPEQIPARDTPPAAETTAQSELDKAGQAATDPELTPETQLELTLTVEAIPKTEPITQAETENVESVKTESQRTPETTFPPPSESDVPQDAEQDDAGLSKKQKKKKNKKAKAALAELAESDPVEEASEQTAQDKAAELPKSVAQDTSANEVIVSEDLRMEPEPHVDPEPREEELQPSVSAQDKAVEDKKIELDETPEPAVAVEPRTFPETEISIEPAVDAEASTRTELETPAEPSIETSPAVIETPVPPQSKTLDPQPSVDVKGEGEGEDAGTSEKDKKKKKKSKAKDLGPEEQPIEQQPSTFEPIVEAVGEDVFIISLPDSAAEQETPQKTPKVDTKPIDESRPEAVETQCDIQSRGRFETSVETKLKLKNDKSIPQEAEETRVEPTPLPECQVQFDGHSEEKVVLDREVEPEKQEEDTLAPILSKNDKKKKNKKKKGKNIESPAEPSTDPEPVNEPADLSEIRKEHELPLESTELPQELVPEQADAARELDVLAEPTERVEPAMESGVDLEPVESGESVTVPLMVAEPSETRDLDISAEPAEVVESAEEPEVVGLPSETAELGVVPEPTERGQSSLGPVSTVKPNVGADTTNEVEAEPALAPIELLQDTTNPTEPFEPDKESAPAPETINTELVPEPEKAEEDDLSSAPTSKKAKKKKKKQKTKLIATAEESTDQTAQTDIPPAFLPINAEEAVTQLAPEGGGSGLLDAPPRLDQRQEIAKNLDESQDTALNPQDDAVITDAPAVDLDASSTAPISETLLDDSIKQPETIFDGAVPEDSAGKRSKKDQKKKNKKGVADTLPENEPSSLLAEDLTLPSSNTTDIPTTEPAPLIERASVENTQAISETPVEVKEELSHPSQEPEQPGGPILTVVDSSDAVARPSKEENLDTRELESRREQSQTVGRPEEEPMETISARQGDTTKAVGQGQLAVPNVLIRDETHGEDLQDDSPKAKASKKDKKKKKKAKLAQDTLEIAPESVPETSLSAVVKTGDTGSPAPDEAGPEKPADEEPIEAVPAEVKSTSIGPIEALTREAPQLDDFVEGTSAEHASLDTMQQHPATEAPVEDFSLKDSPLKPSTENAPVDIVATEGTPANDAPIEDSATLPGLDEATQEPESETSSKKSKKDKKKKAKKLARAMALSESSPAEETVAKEQTPQVETVVEEPAQLQNIGLTGELRDEPISGFLTELLQNEPAQDVSVLVDSFQTPRSIVEEPDQLREVSFTEALREEPTPVIATETPWDEATQKMSVETQPLQTIASSQEPTVVDKQDEEWTLPAKKKKSKKDQKHRLGDDSAMVVPDVEMKSPFPEVSSLLPEAPQQPIGGPPGPISAPSPEQFTSGGVRVLPLSQEVPRSPQKDDEEWALPLKRKSKKGKKTTDAAVSGVEEPLTLSPAETFSLKPTDTVEAETRSITEDAKPIEQPLAPIEQRVPDIPQYVASLDNAKSTALQNVPGSSREPAATNSGSMDVDIPTRDVQERAFPAPVQHDLTWPKEKSRGISLDKEPIATSFQEDRDQKPAAVHEPEVTGPELKSAPTSKLKRKKKQTKPTLDQARQPTSDVTPGPEAQGVKDVVVTVEPGLLSVENTKEISISDPKTPPRSRKSVIDPVAVTPEADRLKSPPKFKEETATASEVAAAVAAGAGGIAALAGRLGSKKKSKEKKELEDVTQADRDVKFEDEFWGGSGSRENNRKEKDATTGSEPKLSRKKVGSIKEDGFRSASPRPKESLRESKETKDSKDKTRDKSDKLETSRDTKEPTKTHDKTEPLSYSNRLKGKEKDTAPTVASRNLTRRASEDMEESPVLGRGNMDLPRSAPQGLLRRESDGEVPMGSLLKEDSKAPTTFMELGSDLDFRRSPSRGLPPVQEIPEAESEPIKLLRKREDINRDSGFAEDSANPQQRGLPFKDEEQQRDSGVHTGDWDDGATPARQTAARERAALQTPEPGSERRLRRSPRGTPVLREPPRAAATPEPEKKKKQYGTLAAAAAAGVAVAAAAAQLRSATSTPSRSVSDNAPASRQSSPLPEAVSGRRSMSNTSLSRRRTPEALKLRPESPGIHRASGTPTPPLRRVNKRMSGDLRALRQQNNTTPVANEGRVRTKDMTDVYDGYGEGRIGSPRSPTRPHSMRRRQSMQVLELENKVEQLLAENRALNDARANAESSLTQRAATTLAERDAEIDSLRDSLKFLQNEVARLSEVNDGLASANAELANKDKARYIDLETRHATTARELDAARGAQDRFNQSLQEKDAEIVKLREQLEAAKEKIRDMQRQILESKAGDDHFLNLRDEDHFDHRCQQLCSHVQQWVLRFSKFSDMRACRLTSEINDEKTIDRLDNAVLDGSDVDTYLRDRVKRRDIFMSMTMNMVWEFVFTRYLFGMDREQRQKLKSLEKLLTEVGPPEAVRQWRAVTLTLLSKRDSFKRQRDLDTEAVVQAIFQTLCKILPPPSNLEDQIQSQLRRVMREAVGLSIEMRTQKAEYMMLPPLQPEYDADGELAATVQFNASMMNERSGSVSTTNEELEAQGAVVRVVLFPLVVKKGDDDGHGDEEIVVCPAQVLIARSKNHPFGAGSSVGARSHISVVTENMGQPEAEYMEGGI